MPIDRVLIVGGGLAGPALALALARQNIRSSVFEIRPQRTIADGSIALAPNALRALDHVIGVYDRLKSAGFSYRRLAMHAEDGQLFGHVSQSDSEYDALRILRSTLHNTMLDACEEQPDLVEVRFGVTITQIEDGEDGVTLRFEDGSSARGDILIGADGIHSKIREHVLGASAPKPTFLGSCMVSGTLPLSSIKAPSDWEFPAVLITSVGMVAVWPHNVEGTEAAWYVSEDLPDKDRAAWREYGASGEAARAAKRNYAMVQQETIRSLMDNVQDDAVTLWTPHSMPDIPTWHRGRVCLIGDAAHALPPNGQGSAMAFEDAAYLSRLLTSEEAVKHGFERVFTKFEKNRRTRIDRVRVLGHGAGAAKGGTPAAWKYMLKKWAMSAYFAWNGYELKDERISSYDVTRQDIGVE
ncbi:putative kynurenine 3-monooxygenase [Mycena olivaceomarginata]|nr:putative kynurenine 3-monooxygenase [Mycena olivaceomarginata]